MNDGAASAAPLQKAMARFRVRREGKIATRARVFDRARLMKFAGVETAPAAPPHTKRIKEGAFVHDDHGAGLIVPSVDNGGTFGNNLAV